MNKIEIPKNGKVTIKWRTLPIDYSPESVKSIIAKAARKYGIPKERIAVEPVFITKDVNGTIGTCTADSLIGDMQDPLYHKQLYKEYIALKEITDCDFDQINEIDDLINGSIEYEKYEKYRKYSLKWIKWSNFMSYGPDNFFDFTNLHGITLLQSEPANQGGKSTFCLDLFRFLLYGKVVCREGDWVLSRVFNDFLPEATEVVVEGCIESEGEEYVIRRTLTRAPLKKRTEKSKVKQAVDYFKVVNGTKYIALGDEAETEQQEGLTNNETNRIIKDIIGNENDFDLMICINDDNLKDLIKLKDTDRGRLLARWVGLLPMEEKDRIARETFNRQVLPSCLINRYSKDDLRNENEANDAENVEYEECIRKAEERIAEATRKLTEHQSTRDTLLQSKTQIDNSLLKVDVFTLEKSISDITEKGKVKRAEKERNTQELNEIGNVDYDEKEYLRLIDEDKRLVRELSICTNDYKHITVEIDGLKKSEFCPTCGQRLQGVDNAAKIADKEKEMAALVEKGRKLREDEKVVAEKKTSMEEERSRAQRKSRLELLIATNDVDISNLLAEYKEKTQTLKDIEKNKSAIEQNNKIDVSLNIVTENINSEQRIINNSNSDIASYKAAIEQNRKKNKDNEQIIKTIEQEEIKIRNWRIYLDLVGKNGVSKLVLRNALPLINGELERMLNDVCDFTVYVDIDDRNDVEFYKVHDGVKAKLGSGSGFEKTVASLALRSVLGKISTFSKPSFVVFDEVLGAVSNENYDKVRSLYEKIMKDYQFIFFITHNDVYKEWANNFVTITKENNISRIKQGIN